MVIGSVYVHLIDDELRQHQRFKKVSRHFAAMGFLVHEVAPSADRLAYNQTGYRNVRKLEEAQVLFVTVDQSCKNTADDTAMDGHAAFVDHYYRNRVLKIIVQIEKYIIQSCTDQRE